MESGVRIGVDVGGTFTDIVSIEDDTVTVTKTPSTPDAPEEGVIDGIRKIRDDASFAHEDVGFFSHGTTVTTNAVLEQQWAETALVTTEGFRDVLEIGRNPRPELYSLRSEKPDPVVDRHRRFEVRERLDRRGNVVEPLDSGEIRDIADRLRDSGVESVAISLLFAFENDAHEREIERILREKELDVEVSRSSVVLPEIREYERTLATALNAALKPVMSDYVSNLKRRKTELGIESQLHVMQSNGGITGAESVTERPVQTLLSGPAAGVKGAAYVAKTAGFENILTMDMGGTSCDVSLVEGGDMTVSTDVEVGEYTVGVPMVEVHTIGAGGGSIGWLDSGSAIRVGPRSAGAEPGPICYDRGGTAPTVTDAHFLLGRIDPAAFVSTGGVSAETVRHAIDTEIATHLNLSVTEAARGIIDIANTSMKQALRKISVERGHDPREFTLVAFGGAGPIHACDLAERLDMSTVLVPRLAGVLSALGLLVSDMLYDYSTTMVRPWEAVEPAAIEETCERLEKKGRRQIVAEGIDSENVQFERILDMRYSGQTYTLRVPVPRESLEEGTLDDVVEKFHAKHRQQYGHSDPSESVELATVRVRVRGEIETPSLPRISTDSTLEKALEGHREVMFDGRFADTPVYARDRLPGSTEITGGAIIEGNESTVVVNPTQRAEIDDYGSLTVTVNP